MSRTKLKDRKLPDYTRGEEIFNMVTHIVGGAFGVIVLVLSAVFSLLHKNYWGFAGGLVYGIMMIFLYTMSSIYHGLKSVRAKKVFQVIDHCSIYALILGTYAPIILTGLREQSPVKAAVLAGLVIIGTAVGVTFTAIDFHRFRVISYSCYFIIGWSVIFILPQLMKVFGLEFFIWLLAGGIAYTSGMIFFVKGIRKRYHHSIFHIFILAGSALQFVGIFKYCIL